MINRRKAEQFIQQFLANGTVDIQPGQIDPEVFVQAIEDAQKSAMLAGKPDEVEKLDFLKMGFVSDVMAGQQQPQSAAPNVNPSAERPEVPIPVGKQDVLK